jgi:hypothetical protein
MMTWTLYLLLLTDAGEWQAMKSRSFTQPHACASVASGLKGRPLQGATLYAAVCKETTNT